MSSLLNFHLAQYEGPLDLLLDLIRKQQINVYDIPLAQITAQYLSYMQQAAELDIELSSEFVFMAATLIHIKSRLLLPRDPELDRLSPEEDPRKELVERLIQHQQFKNAAEMLQQKRLIEEAVWSNPQIQAFLSDGESRELAVTVFDLVKTFESILERVKNRPIYELGKEDVSVPEMIGFVRHQLENEHRAEGVSVTRLFDQQRSRRGMICLFLAILELVKRHNIELLQGQLFGEIAIRRGSRFDEPQGAEEYAEVAEEYQ